MPAGKSNRIVIDVDQVHLKRQLYSALAEDGLTLKDWFVARAQSYLDERINGRQLTLEMPTVSERAENYGRHPMVGPSTKNIVGKI